MRRVWLMTLVVLVVGQASSAQEALRMNYEVTLVHGDDKFTVEEGSHYFSSVGHYRRVYLMEGVSRRSEIRVAGGLPIRGRVGFEFRGLFDYIVSFPTNIAISWDWRNFMLDRGAIRARTTESLGQRQMGFVALQGSRTIINYASGAVQEWEEWTTFGGVQVVAEQRVTTSGPEGNVVRVREAKVGAVEPVEFDAAFFGGTEPRGR